MRGILNIIERGCRKNKSIIFLHGFMGSSWDFGRIIPKIEDKYHCVAIDLPGHGESLFKNNRELLRLKEFSSVGKLIIDELISMGIETFHLYGYSMGGRIAQSISLMEIEHTGSLILESSSFGIKNRRERSLRYKKDSELLKDIKTDRDFMDFLNRWHDLPLFKTLRKSRELTELTESKLKNDPGELRKAIRLLGPGNQPYFLESLSEKKIDVSYIYGTEDKKYERTAFEAEKKIPGINLIPVEDASHNVHIQFPDKIASAIRQIIA